MESSESSSKSDEFEEKLDENGTKTFDKTQPSKAAPAIKAKEKNSIVADMLLLWELAADVISFGSKKNREIILRDEAFWYCFETQLLAIHLCMLSTASQLLLCSYHRAM